MTQGVSVHCEGVLDITRFVSTKERLAKNKAEKSKSIKARNLVYIYNR